jgi:glycosyltransferase involved in cell wall biosynthesis
VRQVSGRAREPDPVRVVAVSGQGPLAPSFRVRVSLMAPELRRSGVELLPLPEFSERGAAQLVSGPALARARLVVGGRARLRQRLARVTDASVCLIQRNAAIWPTVGPEREAFAGRRLVFDVDDALWLEGRWGGGHRLGALKRAGRRAAYLARRADHTIAANANLAEWLEREGARVSVVPSVVDPRLVEPREHADGDELVIGWIGSHSTARYLSRLAAPLEELARRHPKRRLRLLVVGGSTPPLAGVAVEEKTWSEADERAALARIDVGVMPLDDNEWTRGKSAYKALVYMSAGIPVVADDVGMAGEVVGDGGGVLVRTEAGWADALDRFTGAGERASAGAAGRHHVEREFSVERWAPTLAAILRGEA